MAPIALQCAEGLDVSPVPFMFAVTVAASMCFASPFSTPPNALVMSAGQYSFKDYIKVGLPLQVIMGVVMVLVLPFLFPFEQIERSEQVERTEQVDEQLCLRNVQYQTRVLAETYSDWNNTAYKFEIVKYAVNDDDVKMISRISAKTAVYDSLTGIWTLKNYTRCDYNKDEDLVRFYGHQLDTMLNVTPKELYIREGERRVRY
jgi:hypothetical protein